MGREVRGNVNEPEHAGAEDDNQGRRHTDPHAAEASARNLIGPGSDFQIGYPEHADHREGDDLRIGSEDLKQDILSEPEGHGQGEGDGFSEQHRKYVDAAAAVVFSGSVVLRGKGHGGL